MGALSFFANSYKKTMVMNRLASLMMNPVLTDLQSIMNHSQQINKSFESLYSVMASMPGFSDILKKHHATSLDLKEIATKTQAAGYMIADNGDYIPVAVVSFGKPLDYVLTHKAVFYEYNHKEIIRVIDAAIPMLFE